MSRVIRRLVVIFALVGLVSSSVSTYMHNRAIDEPTYLSFCDISAKISCTEVYLSQYGTVRGIPVALGGVIWFMAVLLLATVRSRRSPQFQQSLPTYLVMVSIPALAAVIYFVYVSFFVLKTLCMLCATVYAAVGGIFLMSCRSISLPMGMFLRRVKGDLWSLVTTPLVLMVSIVFVAASFMATVFFYGNFSDEDLVQTEFRLQLPPAAVKSEFERWWEVQPRVQLPGSDDGTIVTVVKFNDYQCPACRQTDRRYRPIFSKYRRSHPGAVTLVIKDYPLDPECNEDAPNGPHDAACEAAVAVRLAQLNGRGERMKEWLYSNQELFSPESVRIAALDVGDVENFDGEYEQVLVHVKADIALGKTLDITGTPAFFINGVAIKGGLTPKYFDAAIAYELERSKNP